MATSGNRHTPWNFAVIVLDASAFMAGFAFVDVVAVLPVLLSNLTDSKVLIGLMLALQRAGWLLPQLLATSFVLHRPRKKPFFFHPCLISRLPFLLLAAAFLSPWGAAHPTVLLWMLVGIFGLFFFGDGLSGVPWHDTIARTIPSRMRGRFFGSMQLLSGLLTAGVGVLVRKVLADPSLAFPFNYGRLMVGLCVGMALSTLFLGLIREPVSTSLPRPWSLGQIIRSIPRVVRRHPQLRQVIIVQNLCGMAALSMPFYAVYGKEVLGLPASAAGIFILAQTVGSTGVSLIWAYINDRYSCRLVIRAVSWLVLAAPAAALLLPLAMRALHLPAGMNYLYAVVFLIMGATWGGAWMGFTNYVMELAQDEIRPLFLGLQSTLSAPTVVMPLLGGWLLSAIPGAPYQVLFGITALAGLVSVAAARRLAEPRPSEEQYL